MSGLIVKLQTELDDNKENLSDVLYKSMSENLLELYNERNFYKIAYLETNVRNLNGDITSGFTKKDKIVRLTPNQLELLDKNNDTCEYVKNTVLEGLIRNENSYISHRAICVDEKCYEEIIEEIAISSTFYFLSLEKL